MDEREIRADEVGYERGEKEQPARRHRAEPGQCATCDREALADNDFHPAHDASPRCESGGRNHCSCDICF